MNILLNSLLGIYGDTPEICEMFQQFDMSRMNHKFHAELFARISVEEVNHVQAWLQSEELKKYNAAVLSATLACSRDLADMIEFVLDGKDDTERLS